ncbi:hypothetical protein MMC13_003552 [Lambiella insularis]|nr:hypothetical protein [Lambiella insularis]
MAVSGLSFVAMVSAGSNHETVVCEGNHDVCTGGPQTGPKIAPTFSPTVAVPAKRSIMDLFRTAYVKREAHTIEGIAQQVSSGTVDPALKAAAQEAGWHPPSKRDLGPIEGLVERAKGAASKATGSAAKGGKKGSKEVSTSEAIAHLKQGKPIPGPIIAALKKAGWTQGGEGGKKSAKGGAAKTAHSTATNKHATKRDAIYAREAALSHQQIQGLLHTMENNPEAEDFVVKAINSMPNVEEFTEKLAQKWLKAREIIPLQYLEARDAEAAVNRAADAAFNQLIQKRDALSEPEAEAEAAAELYFEERDADPEAYDDAEIYARDAEPEYFFEERDAYPEASYEEEIYARDAEPESWIYERDSEFVY